MKQKAHINQIALSLLSALLIVSTAFGADVTVKITDTSGNMVKLTEVTTASLSFRVGEADMTIPISQLGQVRAMGRGDLFEVTLVSGETMQGTSSSSISGEWELGSYSLNLSKAKTIAFSRGEQAVAAKGDWKQPIGFMAEVNGTKVYGLVYEFSYTGYNRNWIPAKSYTSQKQYLWLPVVKGPALYFIPFSKIEQIGPTQIVLVDGTRLDASFYQKDNRLFEGRDQKLKGKTTFGDIELSLATVKTVTFEHKNDLQIASEQEAMKWNHRKFDSDSKLKATITTTNGDTVDVQGLEVFTVDSEGYTYSKSTSLKVYIGEGLNNVELSKLSGIRGFKVHGASSYTSTITASVVTKNGNTLSVKFEKSDMCFGGPCGLGYVKISARDVKAIEIK